MGTFFAYILKTAMFLIVYYLFYKLLMSRETFHRFNRVALVSLLVLSFVLPLCESLVKGTGTGEGLVALEGMLMMATGVEDAEAAQIPTSHKGSTKLSTSRLTNATRLNRWNVSRLISSL